MNQRDLDKILADHKLWLDTEGEQGQRANLKGAYLRGAYLTDADLTWANLIDIKNKFIFTFSVGKHFAYYCDGFIKIGCITKTVSEWLTEYNTVGKGNNYNT